MDFHSTNLYLNFFSPSPVAPKIRRIIFLRGKLIWIVDTAGPVLPFVSRRTYISDERDDGPSKISVVAGYPITQRSKTTRKNRLSVLIKRYLRSHPRFLSARSSLLGILLDQVVLLIIEIAVDSEKIPNFVGGEMPLFHALGRKVSHRTIFRFYAGKGHFSPLG